MQTAHLEGGFADPARDAARAFRAALDTMARPGTIETVTGGAAPAPCSVAAAVLILTLCDDTTPICLAASHDSADVRAWITFHTGAPFAAPEQAMFALGSWPMYVAVKGGERAIDNAHAWLAEERRGDTGRCRAELAQIREQLALAVNRVMAEGSLYDPDLAALAIKQARGDLIEAIFLIRAYRTTLPRFGASAPVDTGAMACDRRISATFKDLPGGQVLGPTFDYTHRLLDFKLAAEGEVPESAPDARCEPPARRAACDRFLAGRA
jgi:hypothetical protein